MKKIFFLAFITGTLLSHAIFAQVDKSFYRSPYESRNIGSFNKSTGLLSFGIGFPNVPSPSYGTNRINLGPLYVKYEHGFLRDDVGLGGHFAVSHSTFKNTGYKDNVTAVSLAIMGYYHFNKLIPVRNLDVYVCSGLSFRNVTYNYDDNSPIQPSDDANVYLVMKAGARYYFMDTFGVYAEGGFDQMSSVNLGVTFRF